MQKLFGHSLRKIICYTVNHITLMIAQCEPYPHKTLVLTTEIEDLGINAYTKELEKIS